MIRKALIQALSFGTCTVLLSTAAFALSKGELQTNDVTVEKSFGEGWADAAGQTDASVTGRCCTNLALPYNCRRTYAVECTAIGGTYGGDGTACCTADVGGIPTLTVSAFSAAIPDGPAGEASVTITVPPTAKLIADVDAQLDINHTWIGDLIIDVSHYGRTEQIWDARCASQDNIHARADDTGTVLACATIGIGPSTTVNYNQPAASYGHMANFECLPAQGEWDLRVRDTFALDVGTIVGFGVYIAPATAVCASAPPPSGGGSCDRTELCHKGRTITVDGHGVCGHQGHGDTVGPCL